MSHKPRFHAGISLVLVLAGTLCLYAQAKQRPTPPVPPPPAAEEPTALEKAEQAIAAKDFPAAITLLNEWVEKNPKDFPAQFNLALLLLGQNRQPEALPHLAAAVELKPDHARAAALYADGLLRAGDRAKAREYYDKSLAIDGNVAAVLGASGRLAVEEKNYELAEKQLSRVVELNPQDRATRLDLAAIYVQSGHVDRAAEVYRSLLQDDPNFAPAHRQLGQIFVEQHKLDQAIPEFEAAWKLQPSEEDDWNLARAYSETKKPDLALPHLVLLNRKYSAANYEVLLLCGEMLNLKREFGAAEGALQRAVQLQPKIPDAYVELANASYLQEQYGLTVAVLDRMRQSVDQLKETPWSYFLRAISLDKLGVLEGAIVAYKRFLEIAGGRYDKQEFQARQRVKAITLMLEKKGKKVPQ